ncbi:MAG: hypothetical protein J6C64_11715 [Lachnospiraceae bacterium]|nr:hypothetical protein [Lachnospiraceae bacterium]
MSKKEDELKHINKEEQAMSAVINQARPCTISESIIESCKEVKSMREGRTPKRSLSELFANIEKWSKEEEK